MPNKKLFSTLPNINVDLTEKNADISLLNNLKEYGFSALKSHDLPLHLLGDVYQKWRAFFSSEEKYQWLREDENDQGFVPLNVERARKEDLPDFKEFYQTHYQGKYPNTFDIQSTMSLVNALVKLSNKLISLIDSALPQKIQEQMCMPLSEMVSNSSKHMLRVVHYPPIPTGMCVPKSAAHGDICLLTILVNATNTGLALKSHDDIWYTPDLQDAELIVFNSDMLDICTNQYLKSVTHEVVQNSSNSIKSRYSIAFSVHPRREIELKKGFSAGFFLKERLNFMGYNGHLLNTNDCE